MQFLKNSNINFLSKRKIAFIISTTLVVLSIAFLFIKSPNWGIDFTGGTLVHLKFKKIVSTKELRNILVKGGIDECSIQRFRNSKVIT